MTIRVLSHAPDQPHRESLSVSLTRNTESDLRRGRLGLVCENVLKSRAPKHTFLAFKFLDAVSTQANFH